MKSKLWSNALKNNSKTWENELFDVGEELLKMQCAAEGILGKVCIVEGREMKLLAELMLEPKG